MCEYVCPGGNAGSGGETGPQGPSPSTVSAQLNEKKIKDKTDGLGKDMAAGPAGIRLKLLKVLGDNIRKSYY